MPLVNQWLIIWQDGSYLVDVTPVFCRVVLEIFVRKIHIVYLLFNYIHEFCILLNLHARNFSVS